MFASEILEIVIGLIFIYLLLSLLGTTISEIIAGLLSMRGKLLKKSLKYLLNDHNKEILFGKFVEHPMFIKLSRDSSKKYPSYMSDSKFSKILLEALLEKRSLPNSKGIKEMLGNLDDGPTKETLFSIWSEAEEDLVKFRKGLEDWFNEVQARATGWYKKNVQVLLVIIGFIIALAFNADTFEMVNKLSVDSKARKNLVELAIKQVNQLESSDISFEVLLDEANLPSDYEEIEGELAQSNEANFEKIKKLNDDVNELLSDQLAKTDKIMGMGWKRTCAELKTARDEGSTLLLWIVKKIIGLILTSLAISLGANFWFDLLNKFIKIRNSGGLPEKEQKNIVVKTGNQ